MRCPKCGYRNRDDEIFCANCGVEIKIYEREISEQLPCPKCGAMNRIGSSSCSSCGTRLDSDYSLCPKCGTRNPASERQCRNCKADLTKPAPRPVSPAPAAPRAGLQQGAPALRCPRCSGPMERGFMLAPNAGMLSGVRWDTTGGRDFWGLKGVVLVESTAFSRSIQVPGFRCPSCRVLVLSY